LGVLKLRTSFQSFLRGAWQDQFALDKLELGNGNGDIVLRQPEEASGIDDGVGNRLVGRDDDVIDRPDGVTPASCPFLRSKQTFVGASGTSAMCDKRT
jgi:hypothetical protein